MNRKLSAHIAITFALLNTVAFLVPKITKAADPQKCIQSTTCKVGEFLYNDDYTENTTATCTITSRDPSGSLYLNAQSLTQANAYYSHSFTPTALGTYPTQICCTVNSQLMCLDKTFEVVTAASSGGGGGLTAAEVWNYSDRSLTSFGTLVEDIWGYSSRSLTSFGNLVSDIWDKDERTLTQSVSVDTTNLATKADLLEINKINKENRVLLEKLVNKPIIQNFIDDKNTVDLSTKITESKNVLDNLFATIQNLKTRSQILASNWTKLTTTQLESELTTIQKIITDQSSQATLLSHTNWLKNNWSNELFLDLVSTADKTSSMLAKITTDSKSYESSKLFDNYLDFLDQVSALDELVGNTLSEASNDTAFGLIEKINQTNTSLSEQAKPLQAILPKISDKPDSYTLEVNQLETKIVSLNLAESLEEIIVPAKVVNQKNLTATQIIKNKIYSLLSLININKAILAGTKLENLKLMWLEEGSIVFRSVAYNPSKSVSQSVQVKFFLPAELKKEQIIAADPELKIDYDATEGSLYASTDIDLAPQQSKTFTVEAEDIWRFSQAEIDILKKQTEQLVAGLKGTKNYTIATNTQSDIVANLDKIMLRQNEAITPENRIKTYRESALEMISITEKIDSLKLLSLQGGNSFNLSILGGTNNMAMWGIVILGLAGFIFLAYYLKTIKPHLNSGTDEETSSPLGERIHFNARVARHHHKESKNIKAKRLTSMIVIGLIATGAAAITTSAISNNLSYKKTQQLTLENSSANIIQNQVTLKIANNQRIPVKSSPSISSPEIMSIKSDQKLFIYKKLNGWAKVGLTETEQESSWWISEAYLK